MDMVLHTWLVFTYSVIRCSLTDIRIFLFLHAFQASIMQAYGMQANEGWKVKGMNVLL